MRESEYLIHFKSFTSNETSSEAFVLAFTQLWKKDRQNTSFDPKFRRLIDRVFTSCDCYDKNPSRPEEISEEELRNEVALLSHIWFG